MTFSTVSARVFSAPWNERNPANVAKSRANRDRRGPVTDATNARSVRSCGSFGASQSVWIFASRAHLTAWRWSRSSIAWSTPDHPLAGQSASSA